eukprot:TRINITY_DN5978_c0_g1_i3.p1 TRINITY_DN5978_c0_g1~~TRINITY_DN5978_c0_g1_i3.p1  ORF type:complete len:170 (-),score=29.76 TRINITY_DN5978_c0_g1_i3:48-557(-)
MEMRFVDNEPDPIFPTVLCMLDATECPIQKIGSRAIQNMFSSAAKDGFLVFLSWGLGGVLDLDHAKQSVFSKQLLPGEEVLADKGYLGLNCAITPFCGQWYSLTTGQMVHNSLINRKRQIVEHTFSRIKAFHCFDTPWRLALHLHPVVFSVVTRLVCWDLQFRPLNTGL